MASEEDRTEDVEDPIRWWIVAAIIVVGVAAMGIALLVVNSI